MKKSVCMATYNGEKYVAEQIKSILSQLNEQDELVISDDHSTDNTVNIIKAVQDNRIKLTVNECNIGYTKNFERALKNSSGDVIFLSDQDDVWVDKKVEIMLKKLETCDMVISNAMIVDTDLKVINESHFDLYKVKSGFWNNFIKTRYIGACMAFKKEVLYYALPFPKHHQYCAHDYWLTIVGEAFFKVDIIETPLLLYRRHESNASSGGNYSKNRIYKKIIVRAYNIVNLVKVFLKII